nr:hypothetical protein [Klebsiella pneumoniae]
MSAPLLPSTARKWLAVAQNVDLMLVSIVLFLSATSGSSGIRELIAERQATLQALAEKGGKLKTQCGKKLEHLCVQISDPNPTVWEGYH